MKWERLNTLLLLVAVALLVVSLTWSKPAVQDVQVGRYALQVDGGSMMVLDTATGTLDLFVGKQWGRMVRLPDGNYKGVKVEIQPAQEQE